MANEDLSKKAHLQLSVGHLLVVWDVFSNKLAGSPFIDSLSEEEKRAIWALEDLCEHGLAENGITAAPEPEWNELIQAAREHVKSIPVEFVD